MKDWCIEPDHPEVWQGHLANNLEILNVRVVSKKVLKISKPSSFVAFFGIVLKPRSLELPDMAFMLILVNSC